MSRLCMVVHQYYFINILHVIINSHKRICVQVSFSAVPVVQQSFVFNNMFNGVIFFAVSKLVVYQYVFDVSLSISHTSIFPFTLDTWLYVKQYQYQEYWATKITSYLTRIQLHIGVPIIDPRSPDTFVQVYARQLFMSRLLRFTKEFHPGSLVDRS